MEITIRTMTEEEKVGLEAGNLALLSVDEMETEDMERLEEATFFNTKNKWFQCNPQVLHREMAEKRFLRLLGLIDLEN
nr:hypothetical protein [uncultured Methanobacterium sp.]